MNPAQFRSSRLFCQKQIPSSNKQDVGTRLALIALSDTYQKDLISSGPTLKSSTIEAGKITLTFHHTGQGLITKNAPLQHIAIAGDDKKFRWATATIQGDQIIASHPEIPAPKFIRYAWADNPASANFFNSENLPAAPFRTDQ